MRTDAKIGFAIVGVLLAVLAVYALVIPRHGKGSRQVSSGVPVKVQPDVPADAGGATPPPGGSDLSSFDPLNGGKSTDVIGPRTTAGGQLLPTTGPSIADIKPPIGGLEDPFKLPPPDAKLDVHRKPADGPKVARGTRRGTSDAPAGGTAVASAPHRYRVRPGQTLSSIAAEVYGDAKLWKQIVNQNPGLRPEKLKVGSELKLPDIAAVRPHPPVVVRAADVVLADYQPILVPASGAPAVAAGTSYRVQEGDSLYKIARQRLGSGRMADELYALNRDAIGADPRRLHAGMVLRLPTSAGLGLLSDSRR